MDSIPPNLGYLVGRKRGSPDDIRWWVPYVNLPKVPRLQHYLVGMSLVIGWGCTYVYIIGIIITEAVLRSDKVALSDLLVVGVLTMPLSLIASIFTDTSDHEFLWIAKWSLLHHRSFTIEDIGSILDGDKALQAIKNIFAGPGRSKILSAYLIFLRLGPRLGLAFMASSYDVSYRSGDFYRRIDWGYFIGGIIIVVGIQTITTIVSTLCVSYHPFIPPNSSVALSFALRQCLNPLYPHGTSAGAEEIISTLLQPEATKYQLQTTPFRYAFAAQFVPIEGSTPPVIPSKDLQKLEHPIKPRYSANYILTSPLPSAILSIALALILHFVLRTTYFIGESSSPPPISALGTKNTKLLLSIILQAYSLILTSFSASIINIICWGTLASSHQHLIDVEGLLAGNNLWNHWNFWEFKRGGLRGILTSWTTMLLPRILVGLAGWAGSMRYYNGVSNGKTNVWEILGTVMIWVSLGLVLFMWIASAVSLAKGKLIPEDSLIVRAVRFRDVVEGLEKGEMKAVRYGCVEVAEGKFKAVVAEDAKEFMKGTYL